jgi:hypothetical protein
MYSMLFILLSFSQKKIIQENGARHRFLELLNNPIIRNYRF